MRSVLLVPLLLGLVVSVHAGKLEPLQLTRQVCRYVEQTEDASGGAALCRHFAKQVTAAEGAILLALATRLDDDSWRHLRPSVQRAVESLGFNPQYSPTEPLLPWLEQRLLTGLTPENLEERALEAEELAIAVRDKARFAYIAKSLHKIAALEAKRGDYYDQIAQSAGQIRRLDARTAQGDLSVETLRQLEQHKQVREQAQKALKDFPPRPELMRELRAGLAKLSSEAKE